MKPMALVGIVLLIIGIIGLAAGSISFTHKEKVIDLGPLEVTADKKDTLPLPALASGAAIVAGLVLLVAGARKA